MHIIYQDAQSPDNLDDVRPYLEVRLATPNLGECLAQVRVDAARVRDVILTRGDGNFLYVREVYLSDWLADPERRGLPYSISPKSGHRRLATVGWMSASEARCRATPRQRDHRRLVTLNSYPDTPSMFRCGIQNLLCD